MASILKFMGRGGIALLFLLPSMVLAEGCTGFSVSSGTVNGNCSTIAACSGTTYTPTMPCSDATQLCCVGSSSSSSSSGACPDSSMQKIGGICVPTSSATGGLSDKPIITILVSFMKWLLAILGILAIIGFVISGIQYLVSSGDERMIETAKRNMRYCIIGVIVALSGFVIIQAINSALNATTLF